MAEGIFRGLGSGDTIPGFRGHHTELLTTCRTSTVLRHASTGACCRVPGTPYRIIDDLQDIDSPSSCLDWHVLSHLESPTTSPRGETAGSRRSCATTLTGLTANGLATAQASRE